MDYTFELGMIQGEIRADIRILEEANEMLKEARKEGIFLVYKEKPQQKSAAIIVEHTYRQRTIVFRSFGKKEFFLKAFPPLCLLFLLK